MSFDPDEALLKARGSVHGFYFDGPSEAESRAENLKALLMCMFEQERKLKLERLMWKARSKVWEYGGLSYKRDRELRWAEVYDACKKELEKL